MQEIAEGGVERARLFQIDGMAAVLGHPECEGRDGALHEQPWLEAWPILVPGHDESGSSDGLHFLNETVQRGAARLNAAHGARRALGGMLSELIAEFLPATRVLVLKLHARWTK